MDRKACCIDDATSWLAARDDLALVASSSEGIREGAEEIISRGRRTSELTKIRSETVIKPTVQEKNELLRAICLNPRSTYTPSQLREPREHGSEHSAEAFS